MKWHDIMYILFDLMCHDNILFTLQSNTSFDMNVMPPPHPTLPNNQSLPQKRGKALSGYPAIPMHLRELAPWIFRVGSS